MRITDEFAQSLRIALRDSLEILSDFLADLEESDFYNPELELLIRDVTRIADAICILERGNIFADNVYSLLREFYISLLEKEKIARVLVSRDSHDESYDRFVNILQKRSVDKTLPLYFKKMVEF